MLLRLALLVVLLVPSTENKKGFAEAENQAFAFLSGHGGQSLHAFLTSRRPAALNAESRRQVLAKLPPLDVEVSAEARAKIAAADEILSAGDRRGVIAVRLCGGKQAQAVLYFRTVILVSASTLDLLNAREFEAVIAHELAHDYDWDSYWQAFTDHDDGQMMIHELQADAIAVLLLEEAGISAKPLGSAVTKMTRWNERLDSVGGEGSTTGRYVPLKERLAFIGRVARERWP